MLADVIDFVNQPTIEWLPSATLVILLVCQPWRQFSRDGSITSWLAIGTTALVGGGLLFWAKDSWLWFALTAGHFWWIAKAYYVADNHYYLMGYWCLAMGLALNVQTSAAVETLAESARLLIGICFFLATVAKLLSKTYRDTSFFVYMLLTDGRFLPVAYYFAGVDGTLRKTHLGALRRVESGHAPADYAPVPPKLRRTAAWLTWWTVAIEATVALVFLIPVAGLEQIRVASLLVFVVTTFVAVPVSPFGQILLLIALALP